MKIKALSIRQPWAWLITRPDIIDPAQRAHCIAAGIIKNIENRSWPTKHRGPVLIHAGKGMTKAEYWNADDFKATVLSGTKGVNGEFLRSEMPDTFERGGIVGYAEIVDCVSESSSRWFMGTYGFELKNQTPLPFMPIKGALGFFEVEVPAGYLQPVQHLLESLCHAA